MGSTEQERLPPYTSSKNHSERIRIDIQRVGTEVKDDNLRAVARSVRSCQFDKNQKETGPTYHSRRPQPWIGSSRALTMEARSARSFCLATMLSVYPRGLY